MATSRTYARCRKCGRHRDDGASLTKRGYCIECGMANHAQQITELHEHSGQYFQDWRRACVAAFGGVLLDDLPTDE